LIFCRKSEDVTKDHSFLDFELQPFGNPYNFLPLVFTHRA
jgi:hypothetical protein